MNIVSALAFFVLLERRLGSRPGWTSCPIAPQGKHRPLTLRGQPGQPEVRVDRHRRETASSSGKSLCESL